MRGQRRVVSLGHAGDDLQFGDAAGIANVWLEDVGGAFFEDFLESPLGKDALARGNGDVGLCGDFGHDVDVEGLDNFLVEPRMIRFERLDEQQGGRRLHCAVKVNTDIDAGAVLFAQRLEALDDLIDELLALDVFEGRPRRARPYLHGVDAGFFAHFAVNSNPLARGAAEQLVHGHAIAFAGDVPKGHINAGGNGGFDWAAAIEGTAMDGLPVVGDWAGVLAH